MAEKSPLAKLKARVLALETGLRDAEKACRTSKGYPTLESEAVARIMTNLKVKPHESSRG